MGIEALTGAIAAMMGGSKEPLTPTERQKYHERVNSINSTSHDHQRVRVRAKNEPISAQATEKYTVLEDVFAEHEQQLKQQQVQYAELYLKYKSVKSENDMVHKDNLELRQLCVMLDQERSDLQKQCKESNSDADNLKEHHDTIEHEYKFASSRYGYLVKNVVQPYAQNKGLRWNDQTKDTVDVVVDPLAIDAVEASDLRDQVRALQKEMLARVEKTEAVTDEQFAQDFEPSLLSSRR